MCTCFQNRMNSGCWNGCGGQYGCRNQNYCNRGCNNGCGYICGGTTVGVTTNTTTQTTQGVGNTCCRYITFPVSGTAYVPTSAIYFCPNTLGVAQTGTNTTNNGNGTGGNCCGFGRCGGAAAINNYFEDYYARQYGLND